MGELKVDLYGPGMTPLHQAGVAGLWMTVEALERERKLPAAALAPELGKTHVLLRWKDGQEDTFFRDLFRNGFRVDKEGLIDLPGLEMAGKGRATRVPIHRGLLGTFLQHNKARPGAKKKPLSYEVNDNPWVLETLVLEGYAHQTLGDEPLFRAGVPREVELAGWMAPGAMVRHNALGSASALATSGAELLALAFAPVGVFIFEVKSGLRGQRAQYAMVIPRLDDLEEYARARRALADQPPPEQTVVSGAGEAALRVLALMRSRRLLREAGASLPGCTVILLGKVTWNSQQKSRTAVLQVDHVTPELLRAYDVALGALPPRVVRVPAKGKGKSAQPERSFVDTHVSLDLIADNLALGRPWFAGFADMLAASEVREKVFRWDWKGLNKMVEQVKWDDEAQRLLVTACHEALRNRYGKISARAKEEKADFGRLIEVEKEHIRVSFSRARNAETIREALTDLWARGGRVPTLQQSWREVLRLLNDENWKRVRDLALLALASYRGPGTDETKDQGTEENES